MPRGPVWGRVAVWRFADVAQLAEQWFCKPPVVSSTLTVGSNMLWMRAQYLVCSLPSRYCCTRLDNRFDNNDWRVRRPLMRSFAA